VCYYFYSNARGYQVVCETPKPQFSTRFKPLLLRVCFLFLKYGSLIFQRGLNHFSFRGQLCELFEPSLYFVPRLSQWVGGYPSAATHGSFNHVKHLSNDELTWLAILMQHAHSFGDRSLYYSFRVHRLCLLKNLTWASLVSKRVWTLESKFVGDRS
jgi:hypothetical protein